MYWYFIVSQKSRKYMYTDCHFYQYPHHFKHTYTFDSNIYSSPKDKTLKTLTKSASTNQNLISKVWIPNILFHSFHLEIATSCFKPSPEADHACQICRNISQPAPPIFRLNIEVVISVLLTFNGHHIPCKRGWRQVCRVDRLSGLVCPRRGLRQRRDLNIALINRSFVSFTWNLVFENRRTTDQRRANIANDS